ncbi:MAG: hypothetical protein U0802_05060 [Candidatus Binatia bacterium]
MAGDERLPHVARRWADRLGLRATPAGQRPRHLGLALALAAALALVALARPQWGEIPERQVSHARDVMIALDLSQSMLADDVHAVAPGARQAAGRRPPRPAARRRVGLTVFAGTAFVQSPLSA